MDVASLPNLCLQLICSAFQRCRVSEDLCRLSVVLKPSPASDDTIVRVSISDTGVGSRLEEFQDLKYPREVGGSETWDGLLSVKTTSICDDDICSYYLNLRESISTRRLSRLPSTSKNGAKFSGTEVYLSIPESVDILLTEFGNFFQKMLILKIPNIAIELVVECGDVQGSRYENVYLANESNPLPFSASNAERLKSGLEDYVLKHGSNKKCESCFPNCKHLKIGTGIACSTKRHRCTGLVIEAVIIISERSDGPCSMACGSKTEVLYFKDFSTCSISLSSLNALTIIDWKSYGLSLVSVEDQGGNAFLEWEHLPPFVNIHMVLHCYNKQMTIPPRRQKTQPDRTLTKRAIQLALDDLKEKHAGVLLSAHALVIRSYAPDLARTIAGLILSSNDSSFQEECFSLLGVQSQESGGVEDLINEKIISVIEMNDRKSQRSNVSASLLFEDDCIQDPTFQEEEYEEGEGEDAFGSLD